MVLAVWLYATLEGIGSARAIDRLCQQHAAYRWLCGGAPINHDLLAAFRRENAALLDRLLTQSVTGLIGEKLVSLFEPHADIILKGGRQVQYGHKLNLVTGKSGLI